MLKDLLKQKNKKKDICKKLRKKNCKNRDKKKYKMMDMGIEKKIGFKIRILKNWVRMQCLLFQLTEFLKIFKKEWLKYSVNIELLILENGQDNLCKVINYYMQLKSQWILIMLKLFQIPLIWRIWLLKYSQMLHKKSKRKKKKKTINKLMVIKVKKKLNWKRIKYQN